MNNHKFLFVPLILTLLFFIRKAGQYAFIGSYIPFILVSIMVAIVAISCKYNKRLFQIVARGWGIVVITWSGIRMFISMMNMVTNTFDEYHLIHQFGYLGIILSLIMLLLGIMIFRNAHKERMLGWI